MVLRKLKNVLAERRLANDKSNANRLGFATIKEYKKFKQDHKNEIRKKILEEKQKKARQKLKDKITYNETTSPGKKVLDIYEKGFKVMDKVQDGIKQFDDAIKKEGELMKGFGSMPNQDVIKSPKVNSKNKPKKNKSKKKKSSSKKSKKFSRFPNSNYYN